MKCKKEKKSSIREFILVSSIVILYVANFKRLLNILLTFVHTILVVLLNVMRLCVLWYNTKQESVWKGLKRLVSGEIFFQYLKRQ